MLKSVVLATALAFGAAGGAAAQGPMATTNMPPTSQASEAGINPANSLPPTAATSNYNRAGSLLGVKQVPAFGGGHEQEAHTPG